MTTQLTELKLDLLKLKAQLLLAKGNWGHKGRPGLIGGSGGGGGDAGIRNFTDEQITQKVHDDRLLKGIYNSGEEMMGYQVDFSQMSGEDRLKYLEIMSTKEPEFRLVDYGFNLKDKIPPNLTGEELRTYLKENSMISIDGKGKLSTYVDANKLTSGLSEKELAIFVDKYPRTLKNIQDNQTNPAIGLLVPYNKDLSTLQKEKLSDKLDEIAGIKGYVPHESGSPFYNLINKQRDNLGAFSSDKEVALYSILGDWAAVGGGTNGQQIVREISSKFKVNEGVKFFEEITSGRSKADFSMTRMSKHVEALKQETEAFYKNKYKTKANTNPDLSQIPITVGRGIGGHASTYTPAATESWTTDKATVDRFGKLMGNKRGYTKLSTTVSYNDVLFSYESVKGKYGWPPDKELKGKKEFAILGGSIKEIQKEHAGGD